MRAGKVVRNIVAVVLFGLLIVSFAFFGVSGDVFNFTPSNAVVAVGREEVTASEYKAQFDLAREQAKEQIGRTLTVDEAIQQNIDRGLLQQFLDQTTFDAVFKAMGVKVGPEVVAAALRERSEFFDPVTGRFDPAAYQDRIGQLGYTPARFEKAMASEIAGRHFAASLGSGLKAPVSFGSLQGAVMLESRDASGIVVTPALAGGVPEPTEAQLRALMTELSARYQRPERRELSFLRLSASRYFETATADPEQVKKLFDFRSSQAGTPETRTLVQIPVKDAATGQAVSQRLSRGEDPDAVAKSVGAQVVRYDAKPKSALPDAKLAEAAFGLNAGQTSATVQGDLGLSVVKVLSITPGAAGDVSKLRTEIEQELKLRDADAKVSEAADKIEDAVASGSDLDAVARLVDAPMVKTPPIDRGGRSGQPTPVAGLSAKLMEVAFALPAGATSEFETEQKGEYFLVRVDRVHPPAMPPFEEIRAQLTADWKNRELDRRLTAKANEIAARLRRGEAIDAVAQSVGGEVIRIDDLSRANAPMQAQAYGQSILATALSGKKGEVLIANTPQAGRLVLKIDSITGGDPTDIARGVAGAEQQFQQQIQQDLGESFVNAARRLVKGKSFLDRARVAIGGPPPGEEGKAGAPADGKAKDKG
jgi:peptidyl-prolyl cis-trans isomerase D